MPAGSSTLPSANLGQGPATPPLRLRDRLEDAAIQLPESNLPPGQAVPGSFVLDQNWDREDRLEKGLSLWSTTYPLRTSRKRHRTAPGGVTLAHGETELRFSNLPSSASEGRWDIQEGALWLASAQDPEDWEVPVTLQSSQEADAQDRLNFRASGLSPQAFVDFETTLGIETRPGLLLPAPAEATWTLSIPMGARLDLGAGLVARQVVLGPHSDGAEVVVRIDGVEAHRFRVRADGEFVNARVDLAAWGGQTVALSLATEPGETPWYDHVLVSEPRLLGPPLDSPRRIVVVGIDTLRWDGMTQHDYGPDTTEALASFAEGAVLFEDALTPAPRTRPSFRTALTGHYPLPAMDAPTLGEHLRAAGFATAGITANVHLVPRMGFNEGFDLWRYDNGQDAEVQFDRAQAWLHAHRDEDAFLFLHLMDPHSFYRAPGLSKNRYVETDPGPLNPDMNRWKVEKLEQSGKLSDDNKAWLRARYDGEVRYMANELASMLVWVDSLPGQTLVVLHSDHGEEFWDHGSYEHNHTLYQELVHGLLWIRPPGGWAGGPHRISDPVGLVDLAPTILDLVGMEDAGLDGLSLRPFIDAASAVETPALQEALASRPRPIGMLMYDTERWGVVADGHKYILETWSGDQELYDLVGDPGEQRNLVEDGTDLGPWMTHLAQATGWPAGAGWRVRVREAQEPFALTFSGPVQALLVDPEANRSRRANLEWGETPQVELADVGTLVISDDRRTVAFHPGPDHKHGLIAVLGEGLLEATVTVGEQTVPVSTDGKRQHLRENGLQIQVTPGSVLLPQDSVRQRLAAREGAPTEVDEEAFEALRALGYIE